jgi:hypothetical protein
MVKTFKKVFLLALSIIVITAVYCYRNSIATIIIENVFYQKNVITYNKYYNKNNYYYVSNTEDFTAYNYQDLLNIFYTIINSGIGEFSFTCSTKYNNCINDVKSISNDNVTLAAINNFVHPYNSYENVVLNISSYGKIKVTVEFIYNDEEIDEINEYIDDFIANNINSDMSDYDKIKAFHDYVINNTKYDTNTIDEYGNINVLDKSHTAFGLIKNGKAICGGYTDIMAIYLSDLGINNYRIATEDHVWNFLNLDGVWYHLDLTFDDPVASDNNQYLLDDYFLISTEQLLNLNSSEHDFNQDIYVEANQ